MRIIQVICTSELLGYQVGQRPGRQSHAQTRSSSTPGIRSSFLTWTEVFSGLYASGQLISTAASQHRGYQRESRARLGYPAKLRPILCDIYPRRMNELR